MIAQAAYVNGSRQLLAQLISNLIENTIKHAAPGREIGVSVRETHGGAWLQVMDRGPGIRHEDRERVLRPFVRLSCGSTGGSGLGLSLVAAIARLHEARLILEDNDPGLRVRVEFGPS